MLTEGVWAEVQVGKEHLRLFSENNAQGTQASVYNVGTGLAPFAKTLPTMGRVGSTVLILGNNLAGTTSVTFNGTESSFTVISPSAIRTTVPAGATSGSVQVITPSGTLTSNVGFKVNLG